MDAADWSRGLSWAVVALATVASGAGLLVEGVYRDNALIVAAFRGNDLITLALSVPLLAVALLLPPRWGTHALLLRLGMLVYALYNYVFYLYGAAFNVLFLAYVGLVGASLLALVLGASAVDPDAVASRFSPRLRARPIAAFMAAFAALLGAMWTGLSIRFLVTGEVPEAITQTGHPTGVVSATDLTILVPGLVLAAVLLWRRHPWGFVAAPAMMLKAATYGLAMIAMSVFAGIGADPFLPLWAALTLGCLFSAAVLLRAIRG